ncbi:MAG: hypothetical protein P8174_03110, partial [Gemmatimonadota bacterium]
MRRRYELQSVSSLVARTTRYTLKPQVSSLWLSGKRRVRNGMANSADQPSFVRWALASHTPRQSALTSRP